MCERWGKPGQAGRWTSPRGGRTTPALSSARYVPRTWHDPGTGRRSPDRRPLGGASGRLHGAALTERVRGHRRRDAEPQPRFARPASRLHHPVIGGRGRSPHPRAARSHSDAEGDASRGCSSSRPCPWPGHDLPIGWNVAFTALPASGGRRWRGAFHPETAPEALLHRIVPCERRPLRLGGRHALWFSRSIELQPILQEGVRHDAPRVPGCSPDGLVHAYAGRTSNRSARPYLARSLAEHAACLRKEYRWRR
jgi:hypothetical protein